MAKGEKLTPGMRVRFTDWREHECDPKHAPPPGTVGTVVATFSFSVLVQWPDGSTDGDAKWLASYESLELAAKEAPPVPRRKMATVVGLCVATVVLAALAYGRLMDLHLLEAVCSLVGAAACLRWGEDVDRQVQAILTERRNMGCDRR